MRCPQLAIISEHTAATASRIVGVIIGIVFDGRVRAPRRSKSPR